ncbi:MAG: hypothetical protein JJU33_01195 [Phycisphaerales bacterium]|nr:hypothetical protein [Phycisphaerales bacterium]
MLLNVICKIGAIVFLIVGVDLLARSALGVLFTGALGSPDTRELVMSSLASTVLHGAIGMCGVLLGIFIWRESRLYGPPDHRMKDPKVYISVPQDHMLYDAVRKIFLRHQEELHRIQEESPVGTQLHDSSISTDLQSSFILNTVVPSLRDAFPATDRTNLILDLYAMAKFDVPRRRLRRYPSSKLEMLLLTTAISRIIEQEVATTQPAEGLSEK